VLLTMSADEFRALGGKYLADTRIYRAGQPHFIDKMPNNFRHIGLIHLMLPNAKIIDARREPMACCFGNLKQLFARGQEFCYSVDDIARYYRPTSRSCGTGRRPARADPARALRRRGRGSGGSVRRILDHCELPFEPACVESTRRAQRPNREFRAGAPADLS